MEGSPSSSEGGGSSSGATKRLQRELMQLMQSPIDGISTFPEGDNLFHWLATVLAPPDSLYAGLTFRLSMAFPTDYPFSPPTVKFLTPCFHPNVHLSSGDVCLDILREKWSAVMSVHTILLSLQSLMAQPNPHSPLNALAAQWFTDILAAEPVGGQQLESAKARYIQEVKRVLVL